MSLEDQIKNWIMETELAEIPSEKDFDTKNPLYYQARPAKTLKHLEEIQKQLQKRMDEDKNLFAAKQEKDRKLMLILKKAQKKCERKIAEKIPE